MSQLSPFIISDDEDQVQTPAGSTLSLDHCFQSPVQDPDESLFLHSPSLDSLFSDATPMSVATEPQTPLDRPATLLDSPPQEAPIDLIENRGTRRKPYDPVLARWCFTCNNPGDFRPGERPSVAYMIFQLEAGKEGTQHLQGYVRFTQKKRLSTVRNTWKATPMEFCHWEPAKAPEHANRKYCSKEEGRIDGPWEYNSDNFKKNAGVQGNRSDLEAVINKINEGASAKTVAALHPSEYIKYGKGIDAYAAVIREPDGIRTELRQVAVEVLYGPTGTGKTWRTFHKYKGHHYFALPGRDTWGNYEYEPIVIFDEFDADKWTIQQMNAFCDCYPCKLDCRYKDKYLAATKIIILANSHPHEWWKMRSTRSLQNAFFRRITACYEITKRTDDPEWTEEQPIKVDPIIDQFS